MTPRSVVYTGTSCWPSLLMKTVMRATGLLMLADATSGVGQFTTEELPGAAMVTPGAAGLASTRVTATDEEPPLSTAVAVTRYAPTAEYL